nr:PREDICTED: protein eyes shut homolog [Equus przewalskii]
MAEELSPHSGLTGGRRYHARAWETWSCEAANRGHCQNRERERQELDPCEAELTILGRTMKASESISHVSGRSLPESGSIFIGGFPDLHGVSQISGPVENFTGCIEVIELNNWRSFIPSKAVKKIHVENCRSQDSPLSAASAFVAPSGVTEVSYPFINIDPRILR